MPLSEALTSRQPQVEGQARNLRLAHLRYLRRVLPNTHFSLDVNDHPHTWVDRTLDLHHTGLLKFDAAKISLGERTQIEAFEIRKTEDVVKIRIFVDKFYGVAGRDGEFDYGELLVLLSHIKLASSYLAPRHQPVSGPPWGP